MVPSFRQVAYYFTGLTPKGKIVADSVWVDVKDVCKVKVEIDPMAVIKPATEFKMFEYMNLYDLACSVGGGEDSSAVLQRAGLTFICNCDLETPLPTQHKCYNSKPDPRIRRAADYVAKYNAVDGQLDALESPYSLAITAYALTLHDHQSAEARRVQQKLKDIANCGRGESVGKAAAESVETTAYALLSMLSVSDMKTAKLAANWLTEQRKYGGGFQSTQDTVVALEALTKYSILSNDIGDLNLRVEMCLENGNKQDLHLTKYNALTAEAVKVRKIT
ncbi:unnamed protein product [Leuciscus chuanchicus]